VKDIPRAMCSPQPSEEKIRIALSGLRGEDSIAELCRKEGIAQSLYSSWSKEFLEAGKKRLAESRTLKGSGAAGVATVVAAGVEVAQQILGETQSAILPLVPYLDTLRGVFIAVALNGIGVAIHARVDDWQRGRR